MSAETRIFGGPVFDGIRLLQDGSVVIRNGVIDEVTEGCPVPSAATLHDVNGRLIMPGLVDLHSDTLEKCIEMRPGVFFDAEFALLSLDQRIAACGITTFCHAISFADNELGLRSFEQAEALVRLIKRLGQENRFKVRHLVHMRHEIGADIGGFRTERMMDEGLVDVFSIMNHTPGQGQFKTLQSYVNFCERNYNMSGENIYARLEKKKQQQANGWNRVVDLAQKAKEIGIPVLSHDDDTKQKVTLVEQLGATGCEFPITMDAVMAAKSKQMNIFMGAPNMIRDCSSNGHLKASDTIVADACDGLVSDYYPECMIQAPFLAHRKQYAVLEQALGLVSSKPGKFLNEKNQRGRLVAGVPADLIVIDREGEWKRVYQTWTSGKLVYQSP
ncbi:MAG: alpha-D-ribose 1-methylphosphonate 5-triphosphate diphosphatase [Desulfobacterales bacterium]|jgi:alpha-D-ribose 1-methylphosphonate 5-triphosphate diphosphatase